MPTWWRVLFLTGAVLLAASGAVSPWVGIGAAAVLVAVLGLSGSVVGRLVAWWAQRQGGEPAATPPTTALFGLAVVLVGYWLSIGTLFWAYLEVVGSTTTGWGHTVGAFGVSWGLGFFALFAPQGLGVFEGTLVSVLDWGADAVLLVAGFRAVLLARDLLLTAVAEVIARRSRAGA